MLHRTIFYSSKGDKEQQTAQDFYSKYGGVLTRDPDDRQREERDDDRGRERERER